LGPLYFPEEGRVNNNNIIFEHGSSTNILKIHSSRSNLQTPMPPTPFSHNNTYSYILLLTNEIDLRFETTGAERLLATLLASS
jgi:hypothetical protein